MVTTANRYFECPCCGCAFRFRFDGNKYISKCPYCGLELEMDKEEYEKPDMEIVFFRIWKRGR